MDTAAWLRGLSLQQYEQTFRDNAIDLTVLPELEEADLEKLGILLGHRKILLKAIAALAPGALQPAAEIVSRRNEGAQRRQLTIMFCDLVDSTVLSTRCDPEDLREVISTYQRCCAEVVSEFGGYVSRYMGDGVLVYFGYPQAHEHDAERAVRAGLALVDKIPSLHLSVGRLDARVGIATGPVVVGDLIGDGEAQQRNVVGETPNLAARLQGLAAPNSVLISESTRRLIGKLFELRDVGGVEVKGFTGTIRLWQPLRPSGVASRFEALRGSSLIPLVGREEEIDLLMRRWARAASGNGQVVLLSGEAGIGKSRIAAAFEGMLRESEHVRVRLSASPHHRDSTLHPVIAHLERAAGFARKDSPQAKLDKLEALVSQSEQSPAETAALLADLLALPAADRYPRLALDSQTRRERTLAALIRQFEALAYRRPVLLIVEDMHWVDSTSRELFELFIERAPRLAVLCVITSRPEFVPNWVGHAHVTMLSLRRLDEREATELVEKVAGDSILPRKIVDQIVAHTDGIPLFVEELTKSLLEGGVMREDNRRHGNGSLPPLAIPSSLHDLLLARLDRLAGAKGIAQVASALGRQFSYELLAAVAQWDDHRLQEALNQLAAAGLILRRGVAPHEYFTFKHALVQDAAYSTLLRDPRRGLHARITSVLNEQFPETGANEPEILAHHYTQAGLTDAAIAYWRKAGERALRRSANVEAVQHLTHGLALTPSLSDPAERERRELEFYLVLGPATRAINGHAAPETLNVFAGARDRLGEHATVREKMSVLYGLFGVHFVRGEHAAAHAVACEAATLAMANADTDLPARADALMGHVLWAMGEFVEARVYLERALEMDSPDTRAPGDQRFSDNHRVAVLSFLAHTLWALGYPEQAVTASETAVARARSSGHVPLTAFALHGEAFLTVAFGADPVVGAQRADEAVSYCVEHGVTTYEQWDRFYQGVVSAERGYPRHGIEVMRRSIEAAAALHAGLLRPTHLGHLAIAYARNDQVEIGIQLLNDAIESIAQTRESLFEAELHRLRGELLSELGRENDAEIEFGRALSSARRQNARLWELRAAMSRAQLWRRQGRIPEAYELLLPIYDWFTEGFATPDLRSAKSLLTELH